MELKIVRKEGRKKETEIELMGKGDESLSEGGASNKSYKCHFQNTLVT